MDSMQIYGRICYCDDPLSESEINDIKQSFSKFLGSDREYVIFEACIAKSNYELLKYILDMGYDSNGIMYDIGKVHVIHFAINNGSYDTIELLLKYIKNINVQNSYGLTALNIIKGVNNYSRYNDIIELLIMNGACE